MRLETVKAPEMGRYFARAKQLSGCINLSLGEPDFNVSRNALNAGFKAAIERKTHYAPTNGVAEFREALVRKANRDYGLKYDADGEVLITVGASEVISLAFLALLNHGDEVLIP